MSFLHHRKKKHHHGHRAVIRHLRIRLWRMVRSVLTIRGTPEAIARGVAIGMFVTFLPLVGIQMIIAIVVASFCKASRPAAIVPVWITNPVTIPPIYAATYFLGNFFWSGPSTGEVYNRLIDAMKRLAKYSFYEINDQIRDFFRILSDVFIPMTIGGIIVGAILAVISYFLTLKSLVWFKEHRAQKRHRRAHRMSQSAATTRAASEPTA